MRRKQDARTWALSLELVVFLGSFKTRTEAIEWRVWLQTHNPTRRFHIYPLDSRYLTGQVEWDVVKKYGLVGADL